MVLRCHRLMDAFAKSDDERDFYLDAQEGFLTFVDLNKSQEELDAFETELTKAPERFLAIPKLTFYEAKKIMEGFINEKVYDIDTKEKLLDIISQRDPRENFLEYLHDHLVELEKWQQYFLERSRVRIIEWLRGHELRFVFEEDLDIVRPVMEKLKSSLFQAKVGKEIAAARKTLETKANTYYSSEALNPRPKRGRPPKQTAKVENEPQCATDAYQTVPSSVRPFLYVPEITSLSSVTFSSKFESEEELLASRRAGQEFESKELNALQQKIDSLRSLSTQVAKDRRKA
jgi:Uncharacterised protein family (UPF0158)